MTPHKFAFGQLAVGKYVRVDSTGNRWHRVTGLWVAGNAVTTGAGVDVEVWALSQVVEVADEPLLASGGLLADVPE